MSIRSKLLILFLAVALIPTLLVQYLIFNRYRKSLEIAEIRHLQDVLIIKANNLETFFHRLKTDILIARNRYVIRKYVPSLTAFQNDPNNPRYIEAVKIINEQLQQMKSVLPDLADIMIINPQGKFVYAVRHQHHAFDVSKAAPAQLTAFEKGRKDVYFSDVYFDDFHDKRFEMLITAPVVDLNDVFVGVVVFEVDMNGVYQIIQEKTALGYTGEALLAKKFENELIYLSPLKYEPNSVLIKKAAIGSKQAIPMQKAVQGKFGAGIDFDYRGKKVIAAWQYFPALDWGIVAKIDISEAFADAVYLQKLTFITIIIMFVFACLIAFYVSLYISKPVKMLAKGAEIIGSGNLDYKVGTKHRDEIGQLARNFDKMTANLKTTTASRDDLNREIKERTQAETMLKQLTEELKRSNKELEQFADIVSHDLREPLRAITGFVELLQMRYKDKLDDQAKEYIQYAVDGGKTMKNMILGLLEYSRVQSKGEKFTKTDANKILKDAIDGLCVSIEENKANITNDQLPIIKADASQITQLFQNLIQNAIKFKSEKPLEIHIGCQRQRNGWLFYVRDNGIGVDPQYHETIFTMFHRVHRQGEYEGHGVGLAVCKRIIERHKGNIFVESEPGKGSTFYFSIPD